jgi:hypothetical protein
VRGRARGVAVLLRCVLSFYVLCQLFDVLYTGGLSVAPVQPQTQHRQFGAFVRAAVLCVTEPPVSAYAVTASSMGSGCSASCQHKQLAAGPASTNMPAQGPWPDMAYPLL